jgi:hypothetical protein
MFLQFFSAAASLGSVALNGYSKTRRELCFFKTPIAWDAHLLETNPNRARTKELLVTALYMLSLNIWIRLDGYSATLLVLTFLVLRLRSDYWLKNTVRRKYKFGSTSFLLTTRQVQHVEAVHIFRERKYWSSIGTGLISHWPSPTIKRRPTD